jgi:hypothetical protein
MVMAELTRSEIANAELQTVATPQVNWKKKRSVQFKSAQSLTMSGALPKHSIVGQTCVVEPLIWQLKKAAAPSRQREIEWLSSNTDKLHAYRGNWIALEGDEIVAWGSDEIEVEMQAKTKGVKAPLLFRIPAETDKPFIGRSLHGCSSIR